MKSRRLFYLLLIGLLVLNLPSLAREFRVFRTQKDLVTATAEKLAPLLASLPAYGTFGYMSDPREQPDGLEHLISFPKHPFANHDSRVDFVIAQYVMAPRILVHTSEYEPIIGNFHLPLPSLKGKNVVLDRAYSGGLCLLKKEK